MIDKQTEESIIKSVIEALLQDGAVKSDGGASSAPSSSASLPISDDSPVELAPVDEIGVDSAHNIEAIKVMRKSTPARVFLGRAGTRPKTAAYLNFLADHAAALDAVFEEVSDQFLEQNNLFKVQTVVKDKDEYLMKPALGKLFSEEAKRPSLRSAKRASRFRLLLLMV